MAPSVDAGSIDYAIAAVQVGLARLLPDARALVVTTASPAADQAPLTTWTLASDVVTEALGRSPATEARRLHLATAATRDRWLRAGLEVAVAVNAGAVVAMD